MDPMLELDDDFGLESMWGGNTRPLQSNFHPRPRSLSGERPAEALRSNVH